MRVSAILLAQRSCPQAHPSDPPSSPEPLDKFNTHTRADFLNAGNLVWKFRHYIMSDANILQEAMRSVFKIKRQSYISWP